ncbi:MAG: aminotransferase class I/II-fold pyridoxal phosphate-dependent enzyme [bacterium]|nr:aminotransferase class I/II-fold pyridoxal phosphate-dependent enzyme [bacterium]
MKRIFTSLSPNVEAEDRRLVWRLLWRPWRWKRGRAIALCEQWFKKYFDVSHAWSVNSGRSGLLLILQALGIKNGDEVLLQAFTCNAVPNPVLWVSAAPIYVDIDEESLNMDPADLEKKITPRAKAIIVQHTFGYPADMDRILVIAKKHNLVVIEDCAHALGARYTSTSNPTQPPLEKGRGRLIGTLGDVAFFSFGRDKVISSVYGGMVVSQNQKITENIESLYQKLSYPGLYWIKQQLLHPIVMELVIRWYSFGKFLLVALQKLHLLSLAVQPKEKKGGRPSFFPRRLPNALAALAFSQLQRLERFNEHRRQIAQFYRENLRGSYTHLQSENASEAIFLRYTMRHPNAHAILKTARKQGLYLGDWYTSVIAPADTDLTAMCYTPGSCPRAERLSREVLNLPTHITVYETSARRIAQLLKHAANE